MRFLSLLLVLSVMWMAAGEAQARCMQRWACVDVEEKYDGSVVFYLRNNKAWPITMTLNTEVENLYSSQGSKVTRTLEGNTRVKVLEYHPRTRGRYTDYDYSFDWAVGSLHAKHDEDYLYRLPYDDGARWAVVQGFNGGYSHRGLSRYAVDFAMPDGSEIVAAREGVVVDVEYRHNRGGASRRYAHYANFIVIQHSDGTTGEYYHLQKNGVLVRPGDKVKRGQLIGLSGSTGFTSLPHLHFAIYKALPNGDTQSLPFKFLSADGVVYKPRPGRRYRVAVAD